MGTSSWILRGRVGVEPTERKAKKHYALGALKLRGRLRPWCNSQLARDCGIIHVTNLLIKWTDKQTRDAIWRVCFWLLALRQRPMVGQNAGAALCLDFLSTQDCSRISMWSWLGQTVGSCLFLFAPKHRDGTVLSFSASCVATMSWSILSSVPLEDR